MKFSAIVTAAVAIGAVALISPVANASTGGASISVSPARVELAPVPGMTTIQHFTITAGSAPVTVSANTLPFTQNSKGQTVPSTMPRAVSGVTWVHVPAPFTLNAGQSKTVSVNVDEPKIVQPGQRYVAVVWIETAHETNAQGTHVNVSGSVAGELIIDVPGKTTHGVTYDLNVPSLSWGSTTTATISAKNTGNAYTLLNAQSVMVDGTARKLPGALLLGGASKVQSGQIPLSWGINHVSYNGVSRTVIALPGTILVLGLGLMVIVVAIIILARRTGRHSGTRARA